MKKKEKYVDDGHTVYSMDNVPTYGFRAPKKTTANSRSDITRKERRAMIRAAYHVYLPVLFGVILCFTAAFLICFLWLK